MCARSGAVPGCRPRAGGFDIAVSSAVRSPCLREKRTISAHRTLSPRSWRGTRTRMRLLLGKAGLPFAVSQPCRCAVTPRGCSFTRTSPASILTVTVSALGRRRVTLLLRGWLLLSQPSGPSLLKKGAGHQDQDADHHQHPQAHLAVFVKEPCFLHVPRPGLEPGANGLRVRYSAIELAGLVRAVQMQICTVFLLCSSRLHVWKGCEHLSAFVFFHLWAQIIPPAFPVSRACGCAWS